MRNKFAWLLAALLSLPLVMVPSGAQAASIYDTTYKNTSTLIQKGYYGCSDQDITNSWSDYLTNDEFSGVEESFALAISQGRWGVSVGYGQVNVFWTEDDSLYLDWMDSVYGGGYSILAKGNGIHRAEFSLSGYYSPKPCLPYISSYWTSATDVVITDKYGYNKNLFVVTDYLNYPPNYDGSSIPSEVQTTPYTGTLDCGVTPTYMLITQGGRTNAVTLSPSSITGIYDWAYYLTSGTYMVTVECGGNIAHSPVVSPDEVDTDWVCDVFGDPPYYCQ